MDYVFDMLGHSLGSVTPGDFADTLHGANGAFAGQVVHGIGGNPDFIQNSVGQTIGSIHHDLGGGMTFADSAGQAHLTVQPGMGGGPDLLHDAMGGFAGAIQHGIGAGMPDTLLGSNWQPLAQSFGVDF